MPVIRLAYKRIMLWGGGLIGLAAATWCAFTVQTHFMDLALSVITVFVGTSVFAVVFIFLALLFYEIVVKAFLSDN